MLDLRLGQPMVGPSSGPESDPYERSARYAIGCEREQQAIASTLGVDDRLVITPGASGGLAALMDLLLPATVVAPLPFYGGYRRFIDRAAELVWYRPSSPPEPDRVPPGSVVLVNEPHNPTGTSLGLDRIRQLVEQYVDRDCRVVLDAVYAGLDSDVWHVRAPGLVTIGSLSKTCGRPGLRLGFAVGDASLLDHVERWVSARLLGVSAPSLALVPRVLESWRSDHITIRQRSDRQATALDNALKETADMAVLYSGSVPYALVFDRRSQIEAGCLQQSLATRDVLVPTLAEMGLGGAGRNQLRIPLAIDPGQFARLVPLIVDAVGSTNSVDRGIPSERVTG